MINKPTGLVKSEIKGEETMAPWSAEVQSSFRLISSTANVAQQSSYTSDNSALFWSQVKVTPSGLL